MREITIMPSDEEIKPLSDFERREINLWYSNFTNLVNISIASQHREIMMIGEKKLDRFRWLSAYSVRLLKSVIDAYSVTSKRFNIYRSCQYYKKIPIFSYENHIRYIETTAWQDNFRHKELDGADLVIDIDNKEPKSYEILKKIRDKNLLTETEEDMCDDLMKEGYLIKPKILTQKALDWLNIIYDWRGVNEQAVKLKTLLDRFNIRYAVWMSGEHGYHFTISKEEMPKFTKNMTTDKLFDFYRKIATTIDEYIGGHVDLSVYQDKRIFKCPYTLAKNTIVILPLDNNDFNDLIDERLDLTPSKVLERYNLRGRGIFLNGIAGNFEKVLRDESWQ